MSDDSYDNGGTVPTTTLDHLKDAYRVLAITRDQCDMLRKQNTALRLACVVMMAFCLWFAWAMWRKL